MKLTPGQLRRQADEHSLGFASTAEIEDTGQRLAQERADRALGFAMAMRFDGYNLYALGVAQLGMHDFVRERLKALAAERDAPDDWCYLHHFDTSTRAVICRLPPGLGRRFKHDVAEFLRSVRATLPSALSGEEYQRESAELGQRLQQRQLTDTSELQRQAPGKR